MFSFESAASNAAFFNYPIYRFELAQNGGKKSYKPEKPIQMFGGLFYITKDNDDTVLNTFRGVLHMQGFQSE